ncbi:hypothetical protein ABH922_002631 [Rhodococcus sp. 27YEA15]|uniref:YbjN domain-containing protein n=1 Tax=Rhodococcus sp. 27YEA15 TaxID=3156259 RepID=UPI003C7CDD4B
MTDNAALLQQRAAASLAHFASVDVAPDGSLGFQYAGALCSIQAMNLSDGLDVIAMTCVLAWDRPVSAALHRKVADRNRTIQFGSIAVFAHGSLADVILRYTFPAAGLDDEALTTILLLVLGGADSARQGLIP